MMNEISIVIGILAVAGIVLLGQSVLQWEVLLWLGISITALGLATGVPTGFYYHFLLRKTLKEQNHLPNLWWLFPTRLHPYLKEEDLKNLKPWLNAGAAGFFISIAGCALLFMGLIQND